METNIPIDDSLTLDQAVPKKSKYLSKEDVVPAILVQISHLSMDDVESNNVLERCTILNFHGDTKPMILNLTNKELLKVATGEVTAGGIKHKKIVIYNDETVMFGGKMVGGARIRKALNQPPEDNFSDSIPF